MQASPCYVERDFMIVFCYDLFWHASSSTSLTPMQSAKWAVKPVELSPLHCSRYGWVNNDNDCLTCVTCKASIDASLPDNWDHETCEYYEYYGYV